MYRVQEVDKSIQELTKSLYIILIGEHKVKHLDVILRAYHYNKIGQQLTNDHDEEINKLQHVGGGDGDNVVKIDDSRRGLWLQLHSVDLVHATGHIVAISPCYILWG